MRGAFVFASPPIRIASSSFAVGAAKTSAHVGNARFIEAHARSRFTSEVFCDSTVKINSSSGSRFVPRGRAG